MKRSLEQRVQELEVALRRSRTRGRILLLIAATAAAIGARQAQQVPDVIRAHAIEVVDNDGIAHIQMKLSSKADSPASGELQLGRVPKGDPQSPIAEIQVGQTSSNSVSIAANAAGAALSVCASTVKKPTSAEVNVAALNEQDYAGDVPGEALAKVETRAARLKRGEVNSRRNVEATTAVLHSRFFDFPPNEGTHVVRRSSALHIDFDDPGSAQPTIDANVEERTRDGKTSRNARVATEYGPDAQDAHSMNVAELSAGCLLERTRSASLGVSWSRYPMQEAIGHANTHGAVCINAFNGLPADLQIESDSTKPIIELEGADDLHDGRISVYDKQGKARATMGSCELVTPTTSVKTTMPPNSLVLFNESGNVVERLPRQ